MSSENIEPIFIDKLPSTVYDMNNNGNKTTMYDLNKNKLVSSVDTILKYENDYYVLDTSMLRNKNNIFYECIRNEQNKMVRGMNITPLNRILNNGDGFIKSKEILDSHHNMFEVDFNRKTTVKSITTHPQAIYKTNCVSGEYNVYELTPMVLRSGGGRKIRKKKTCKYHHLKKRKNKSKSLKKRK